MFCAFFGWVILLYLPFLETFFEFVELTSMAKVNTHITRVMEKLYVSSSFLFSLSFLFFTSVLIFFYGQYTVRRNIDIAKKKNAKTIWNVSIQKGIVRLISNVQGVYRAGKMELLFSGLFAIFIPFELCHFVYFVYVCVFTYVQHLSAFAQFRLVAEEKDSGFSLQQPQQQKRLISIKEIGLNHHYGDGKYPGFRFKPHQQ